LTTLTFVGRPIYRTLCTTGLVLFAGKTASSMSERFVCTLVQKGAI